MLSNKYCNPALNTISPKYFTTIFINNVLYFEGRCVPFVYGGCGGTENLFDDELECGKTCDQDFNDDTPAMVDVCGLRIDSGPCRMTKPMFAFNSDTKRCEKFFYGGMHVFYILFIFQRDSYD